MPRKILAPHKEQDGWVYVRVPRTYLGEPLPGMRAVPPTEDLPTPMKLYKFPGPGTYEVGYPDTDPGSRVISSRRVEEALETAAFLKLCAEEELYAAYWPHSHWLVAALNTGNRGSGTTLREAYYRYKAEAVASEPAKAEPTTRYCADCKHRDSNGGDEPCVSCIDFLSNGDWPRPGWEPKND